MKKHSILTLLFVFCATVFAQAQSLPGVQLGIKGALNYSKLKSDDDTWLSSSNKSGYQAGIWARFGGAIHLQPELYVTGKSTEATIVENTGNVQANVNFTTLDLPVLLGSRIGLGPLALRIQAGPVMSIVIDKNIGDALAQVGDFNDYKNQSFGITGGLGVDFGKLRADVRYEQGLSSLSKNDVKNQKMSIWSVGVGLRLF
jgi:hypothetical protein